MRVTKRTASHAARRRAPLGVWIGVCGFLVGLLSGVLATRAVGAGTVVSWVTDLPDGVRSGWADSRLRSQFSVFELSLGFEAYEELVAPEFRLRENAGGSQCVPATVTWQDLAGDVQLCPPRTPGLSSEVSFPAFELREEIRQSMHIDLSLEVFLQDVTLSGLSAMLTEQFTERIGKEGAMEELTSPSSGNEEGMIEGAI